MIKDSTINADLDKHFRYLFFVALFPILLSLFVLWLPTYNLSAVEIPLTLLPEPGINSEKMATDWEMLNKPIHLDPPSDAYVVFSAPSANLSMDALTKLPEVRQKVDVDFRVSLFRKKKREDVFTPIILKVANQYKVDPAIIKAIIMAESSYNPKAVSNRGARGLMQLMPGTAKALGVKDLFNPEQNITAGVRYFKQLLEQFNHDTALALAAYNAGSRKVRKYKGVPPFKATRKYIKNVLKYQKIYREELNG